MILNALLTSTVTVNSLTHSKHLLLHTLSSRVWLSHSKLVCSFVSSPSYRVKKHEPIIQQFMVFPFAQRHVSIMTISKRTLVSQPNQPSQQQDPASAQGGETVAPTPPKKQSKFKQFYSQYGPIFIVIHLITVVLWIYAFFQISKQYLISRVSCLFFHTCAMNCF